MKTVGRSDPFQRTDELTRNSEPLTVSVNPGPPAVAVFGEILFNVGAGGTCAWAAGANSQQMMIAMNAVLAARRRTMDSRFTSFSSVAAHAVSGAPGELDLLKNWRRRLATFGANCCCATFWRSMTSSRSLFEVPGHGVMPGPVTRRIALD